MAPAATAVAAHATRSPTVVPRRGSTRQVANGRVMKEEGGGGKDRIGTGERGGEARESSRSVYREWLAGSRWVMAGWGKVEKVREG